MFSLCHKALISAVKHMQPKFLASLGIFIVLPFLAVFPNAVSVHAATYYVAKNGTDSNRGTEVEPWLTIQKAANTVNPGDTVIVKDGVYTDTDHDNYIVIVKRGGTANNWITFKSENKWGAVLDGQDYSTGYGWVLSEHANYIRIQDFEVRNTLLKGFHNNAGHVGAGNYIYLYSNHIHHIGRTYHVTANAHAGIYVGTGTHHISIDSNVIHHIGRLPQGDKYDYNHDHGIYCKADDVTIINNLFYNNEAGWSITMDGGDIFVSNNTFAFPNPGRGGHLIISPDNCSDARNGTIQNNIFFLPNGSYNFAINVRTGLVGCLKNFLIRNNITTTSLILEQGDWGDVKLIYNKVGIDPLLVDPDNYDFRLQSISPAIDTGYASGAPSYDYDHNIRPKGSGYDIGAYEYNGSSPDDDPPSAPTGLSVLPE